MAGYLFIMPDALGLLVFVGAPMLLSLSLGFFEASNSAAMVLSGSPTTGACSPILYSCKVSA